MDFAFSFLKTVSALSVVLAALWFLVPKDSAGNIFKYAMGIFAISVVISTFNVTVKNPEKEIPAVNTDSVINNAQRLSNETVKYVLEELLYKCNIKFNKIDIITDNSDSSDINITKARICFENEDDYEIAEEIIKKQTGIVLIR